MKKNLLKALSLIVIGSCLSTIPLSSASAKSVQAPKVNSFISMPSLSNVRIASYWDANSTYGTSGGTIRKSALPFGFLTTKSGFGGVRAVSIDGVDLTGTSTFDMGGWASTEIKTTFNNNYIKGLKTGTHTVKMVCWDVQRDYTLSDSFSFNLVD